MGESVGEEVARRGQASDRLRIVHVMRAPVGGLFRHVLDLARAQAQAGHDVGVIADSSTGGAAAAAALDDLAPLLTLGLTRFPMHRQPHPGDIAVAWRVARLLQGFEPDVVHGHGAKGGLYARLGALLPGFPAPHKPILRVYTPHGGSLHFSSDSLEGRVFFAVERALARVTDFTPFESAYALARFSELVGPPGWPSTVVHNGLAETEFVEAAPASDATDFLYVGELRFCKGVDTLIAALAEMGGDARLTLVGFGPDEEAFRALATSLGVAERIVFQPPTPIRKALRLGRILVAPSRAESLPYVVLEAIAARLPVVATRVGGLPEIFGANARRLVPPDDPGRLAAAMRAMRDLDEAPRRALTAEMADFIRARFTLEGMAEGVLCGYRDAIRHASRGSHKVQAQLQPGD